MKPHVVFESTPNGNNWLKDKFLGTGMYALDNGAKLPPIREAGMPANMQKACEAYADAYYKLYRRMPSFEWTEDGFIRVDGKPGVKSWRLSVMTDQLRSRLSSGN